MLHNKTIVIGVTGGIAAYKACDVVSKLRKRGASVYVIMTEAASKFVAPLTFQTLSNHFVVSDMFAEQKTWEVEHISLAKKADLMVIVPATADIIGKLAAGIADDMLTTTAMACRAPVMLAPAMNTGMYHNPIVQENIRKLTTLGYPVIEPVCGMLACGDEGEGKLADVDTIVEAITSFAIPQDLKGKRILVTAGPTRELIDPVRYITNRSSGKMGYAVAAQAAKRGADVTLISGPIILEAPAGIRTIVRVETAAQMYQAVIEAFPNHDAVIQSAAVADYRPKHYSGTKIKKADGDLYIELERTDDIAYEIGKIKGDKILVGFAAETDNVTEHAVQKIKKKNFDFIVANDVTKAGAGFNTDTNIITIIDAQGTAHEYPQLLKTEAADIILDTVAELFNRKQRG
nr:bifunctional phosphopantothenoylcysteine decarboxylase/phosphopantothenate--cysteine ligase CoaBC [uncultured Treponema sp.]